MDGELCIGTPSFFNTDNNNINASEVNDKTLATKPENLNRIDEI